METSVFVAVLFAAACHAGWNAVIKIGLNPLPTTTLISLGAGTVSLVLLPVAGLPGWDAWPWVVASVLIHLVYFAALIESYRTGDMGQVYPIARGSAPLMTAALGTVLVGETLSVIGWSGIVLLVAGVLLLSLRGGRDLASARFSKSVSRSGSRLHGLRKPKGTSKYMILVPLIDLKFLRTNLRQLLQEFQIGGTSLDRRTIGFALLTALMICAYSLVDGIGARVSGNANGYSVVLFAGIALIMIPYALWRGGPGVLAQTAGYWRSGLAGGTLQLVSYGIAIWAMTAAPIAMVAALRETSVLFGAGIAVVVLKEPLRAARMVAATLIVCGLALIRLQ